MNLRRSLSLLGIVTVTSLFGVMTACGDDTTYVYVYADSGAVDARARGDGSVVVGDDDDDTAATSCTAIAPPTFNFVPPGQYLGKCTDAQISTILTGCVFGSAGAPPSQTTCDAAKAAAPECGDCMVGVPTSPVGHPLIQYDPQAAPEASQGVCMTAFRGETAATDCGFAFAQIETCALASCTTPCLDATEDAYGTCIQSTIGTSCTVGLQTFSTTACSNAYKDESASSIYGFCTNTLNPEDGGQLNNLQFYTLVTNVVCGTNPNPDAGTTDAGTDAGDAGDASDAGDGGPQ